MRYKFIPINASFRKKKYFPIFPIGIIYSAGNVIQIKSITANIAAANCLVMILVRK